MKSRSACGQLREVDKSLGTAYPTAKRSNTTAQVSNRVSHGYCSRQRIRTWLASGCSGLSSTLKVSGTIADGTRSSKVFLDASHSSPMVLVEMTSLNQFGDSSVAPS